MVLDEIIRKTTITFPKSLSLRESKKLFNYISENLPANISYNIGIHNDIYYGINMKKSLKDKGLIKITGKINNVKKTMSFDSFYTQGNYKGEILSIEFQRTPGWNINEYRPEVRKLWDDVRNLVDEYFKEVLKKK